MQTRSSSRLASDQSSNPTSSTNSNPKGRNRGRSKHRVEKFNLEEHSPPVVTMADQRTMTELLRAPTEGYAEAIVVPPILAEQFELKHSLINMMTTDQFFGLEKDNPHDHIRAAHRWLEKKPPRSIHTWEDLISKFINEFFPSSRTTNLRNEISNFQQWFDESFHEAWDRYKDLLRACPHHGFSELHQLDTFYNALNPADQDSLNVTAGGNLLERSTQDVLMIIENKSKQTSAVTTAMTAMLKQFQATPPPAPVKAKMLKALLSNNEKLQELANTPLNENCSAVILKKLPEKLRDPGKFLIPCGFSLPELIPTRMTLELANRAICTPAGIARDVFVSVGKFTFLADFVIVDYESDPRVPLILGRPFLRTAHALIEVYGEEMILRDGDERLTLNMRHDTSSYSNQPQKESINLINVFNNSSEDFLEDLFLNQPSGNPTFSPHPELTSPEVNHVIFDLEGGNVLSEKLLDLDSTKDLHPPPNDNPLSGSTTYFSNPLLEEFADELPPEYDDNLQFDIESDLKEIEFLLYQDKDSSLKDSIDQKGLANLADIFVDSTPEMFIDEHALDYSSPPIFDEYDDDFL
nr:reverse transcriptase domain-containing protein [Tanacetum cinerariifolium]